MNISQLGVLNHHAYCFIGDDSIIDHLISFLRKNHSIVIEGNSDFSVKKYDSFAILDARDLKEQSGTRPVSAETRKIFVLQMNGITIEAQNALLKLLEEPAEYAHFFIIIPSAHLLLPTVKSRLSFVDTESIDGKESNNSNDSNEVNLAEARRFLKLNTAKKLEYVKNLVDDISKEKKMKQNAINFLNDIEKAVYTDLGARKGTHVLETIDTARKYANDRSPSLKMLLESVALMK